MKKFKVMMAFLCAIALVFTAMAGCTPEPSEEPDKEIAVESVTLDETAISLLVGESKSLRASVLPDNATNKRITWKSSNAEVATVSVTGNVTAVANGTATIIATAKGDISASCTVTVSSINVTGIDISETTVELQLGSQRQLTVTLLPENASDKTVVWASDDETVACVTNGQVTALKAGTTKITATASSGLKATCNVTVTGEGVDYSDYVHIKTVQDYLQIVPGNGKYCLDNDIDFKGADVGCIGNSGSYNSQNFSGIFDGRGYSIKNAYFVSNGTSNETGLNNNSNCAMFYKVNAGGIVRNVNFIDCVSEGEGYNSIVAVWLEGATVENIYVQAFVANNNEWWDGWTLCGMIVGLMKVENGVSAKLRNCIVYGASLGITYGFVGSNYTEYESNRAVENCYLITPDGATAMNMVGDISADWSGGAQPIFDCFSLNAEEALLASSYPTLNPFYWQIEDGKVPYLRTEEGIVREYTGYSSKCVVLVDETMQISLSSGQKQIKTFFRPAGIVETLTWESDNQTVATVSAEGIITPISVGTAKITVTTEGGYVAECTVTVVE